MLVVETNEGERLEFAVVGIVEDDEHRGYSVCYSEAADEFVVTDAKGTIIEDDDLAQEILDDFFALADQQSDEESAEEDEDSEESPQTPETP